MLLGGLDKVLIFVIIIDMKVGSFLSIFLFYESIILNYYSIKLIINFFII